MVLPRLNLTINGEHVCWRTKSTLSSWFHCSFTIGWSALSASALKNAAHFEQPRLNWHRLSRSRPASPSISRILPNVYGRLLFSKNETLPPPAAPQNLPEPTRL